MTSSLAAAGRRDPLAQHLHLVDAISSIAPPPPQWTELRERWDEFTAFTDVPMREKLVAAVLAGAGDIPMLRALANAEAAPERSDIVIAVRAEVYPRLIQAYSEVGRSNYTLVGEQFDAAATEFTAAAKKCDPEASSDAIVGQPDSVR
jgi:hypothetical protein